MAESKQRRNGRLMTFQDFIKRRSLTEEGVVIASSGASLIRLDNDQTTEERQSAIDEFGEKLRKLSSNGRIVIGMAVALD